MQKIPEQVRAELAPSGRIRVGLNYQNFLLVHPDAPDGSPTGIAPDVAREVGQRAGLPIEFSRFEKAGLLADAVIDGVWDVALLGAEPQREGSITFTFAYLEIPVTFLVPPGSRIRTLDDIDREGVRIAVAAHSAYDLYLTRTLKHARLLRASGIPESCALFVREHLEALAGLTPQLVVDAQGIPGSLVLDGQVTAVQQALGVPQGHGHAARWLTALIEELKASGFIEQTIRRHAVLGVTVAPPRHT